MDQLETALTILIDRYPFALRVLFGDGDKMPDFAPPSGDEIPPAKRKTKRPGLREISFSASDFDAAIANAGGWPRIIAATREYARRNPRKWKIFSLHFVHIKHAHYLCRVDGSILQKIARENGMSKDTLRRLVNSIPSELAAAVYDKSAV
jgi:hypothetical protein